MIIAQEPRWRRLWPWALFAPLVAAWFSNPIWPLVPIIIAAGWGAQRISDRRQRTALSIEDGDIVIVNEFSTRRVPIEGASIRASRLAGLKTGNEEVNRDMEENPGKALFVIPADRSVEMIEVSAVKGLMPREFERVVAELQAAIAIDG